MNFEKQINRLFKFYKFEKSTPRNVKKTIRRDRSSSLKYILIEKKSYSIFTAIVIFVFFLIRKIGYAITFTKAAVVTIVAGILIAFFLAAGSIVVYNNIYAKVGTGTKDENPSIAAALNETTASSDAANAANANIVIKTLNYKIAIAPFDCEKEDREKARKAMTQVMKDINGRLGNSGSYISPDNNYQESPYVLKGALIKVGGKRLVSLKFIDMDSSKIIYLNTVKPDDRISMKLAVDEIISKIK